jgi:hypothetical protein
MHEAIEVFPLDRGYLTLFVLIGLASAIAAFSLRGRIREEYKTRKAMRKSGLFLLVGGAVWLAIVSLILLHSQPNADAQYLIQFLLWRDLGVDRLEAHYSCCWGFFSC